MIASPAVVGLTLNYRDAPRSVACVRSLLADGAVHVLVWDNSDDAGESAHAIRAIWDPDHRVSIEISPANLGFAAGVNRGMDWIARHHPGAWVLLINNDAHLLPGALAALRLALVQHPEASLAYPAIDQAGAILGTVYYQRWFGLLTPRRLPGSHPHASGCCMLLNTERIGPAVFDEDFFMYGEDAELGCRLRREPGALRHVPAVWVRHEGSASSGLGTPFYESRMVAAHLILARKLAPGPIRYAGLLLGRGVMLSARAMVRALRYRSMVPLRALREGMKLARGKDPLRQRARCATASTPIPRVLLVSRNFPPLLGGMERLNQHLLQELEREYEVHLVGPRGARGYLAHPERAWTCPPAPASAFLACATIQGVRLGRQQHPRLIIAGSGVNAPAAWAAARACGARWLVYLHGLDLVADHLAYQRLFLPVIRRADAWLVNSHATARLAAAAGLDAARTHILHPGVALPETLASPAQVWAWRERHGLGERPLLLSVGRLTKRKGLREFVIHALPAVLAAYPRALLVVIGEEPTAAISAATIGVEALREAARASGTQESLRILGRLSDADLGLAYQAASALVFPVLDTPGDIEGFGMVAIEAAAHGLPTVAFMVGGVPDAIGEGISGYLITPGDYAGMAARLNALLSLERSRDDTAACIAFASRFAWPRFGTRLRQLCRNLMIPPSALPRSKR